LPRFGQEGERPCPAGHDRTGRPLPAAAFVVVPDVIRDDPAGFTFDVRIWMSNHPSAATARRCKRAGVATRRPASRKRTRPRRGRRGASLRRWWLLLGIALLAVAAIALIGPRTTPSRDPVRPLSMAQARASNAAVPIVRRRAAAPYRFRGGPAARAQAVDCLATAALYEVGNDPRGQRAVMQVVLNRVRRPGFPKTICGVVYQGAARATGCQFSFTCDRSFARRPQHTGWARARRQARRALSGGVVADVGRATHYHADWVVPYWRDSLVKVGKVGPHLFYERGGRTPGQLSSLSH
jgi:spore germination cell wall hydrolase CwlJ-like protein